MGRYKTQHRTRTRFCAISLTLLLSACGGGGGGQDPDPVVVDIPVAYVERPLPMAQGNNPERDDVLDPAAFHAGARLLLRDRASPGAAAQDISAAAFAANSLYDVKDLEVSFDGSKLLFAMRAPEIENADEDEQPTWNIWEYEIASRALRRIIASDISAEAGQDVAPHYLADGRVVFSSTRQRQTRAILLDEGKPQYSGLDEDRDQAAFVLHVMDQSGTDIRQISFNQSHDLDPLLLADGTILFSRWDNAAGNDSVSLYRIRPDGRELSFVYGFHSQDTGTNGSDIDFVQARQLPDGETMVLLRPRRSVSMGGDIVRIETGSYTENYQPTADNPGLSGPAQQSLSFQSVTTDDSPSPHGYFSSAAPLYDGTSRLLVSWSQCRLQHPVSGAIIPCTADNLALEGVSNADPLYGIWIYNLGDGTQKPVIHGREGVIYSDVVALEARATPEFLHDGQSGVDLDSDLLAEGLGVLHIRSVYDLDGSDTSVGIHVLADPLQATAAERPARFVRIVKAVTQPDRDLVDVRGTAFGRSSQQLMREIIGYSMVEPDGSVKLTVPANIPFAVSVLDAEGRRIGGRHNHWLQLMPGEQRECNGCHSSNSELPHGRPGAGAASINTGAADTGLPFPNTDPALFADAGETMAETRSRINGIPSPIVNIEYLDLWTDASKRPGDMPFAWLYRDLATAAPTSSACQTTWLSLCRIVINYETHVQPLWDRDRQILAADGVTVLSDSSCNTCHSPQSAAGTPQVPAAQLELSNAPSSQQAAHLTSYRELLFTGTEQVIVDGALQLRREQATDAAGNPLFETDADGNLVLDAGGNPIPVMVTFPVPPVMSVNGARASARFFAPFTASGSHAGYLDPVELKLISEWLDIGAQYYNNPFDVPQN